VSSLQKNFIIANCAKEKSQEKQKEFAGKFAEYCEKENNFLSTAHDSDIFAKNTGYKIPIIGINLMHTQSKIQFPSIILQF